MIRLKLEQLLKEKEMTRYRLAQLTEIHFQTIDKYYKNKLTRYDGYILSQICKALDCGIGDLMEYVEDKTESNS